MTNGPYLYDDDPAPLHTGTPRSGRGFLIALLAGTALAAVGMVAAMYLVKGSPEEQAQEVAGVFLAALENDDTETAHQLLCQAERARLQADEVAGAYLGEAPGELSTPHGDEVADGSVLHVPVRWADDSSTEWTVIGEDGPRICGIAAAG
jgi:hypothetical protein